MQWALTQGLVATLPAVSGIPFQDRSRRTYRSLVEGRAAVARVTEVSDLAWAFPWAGLLVCPRSYLQL